MTAHSEIRKHLIDFINNSTDFRLVYQSGHGDVWCNDKIHIQMNGARFGHTIINNKEKAASITIYRCNCDKFK